MGAVSIIFTGGTISMTVDPASGGATPSLSGGGLLAQVDAAGMPELRTIDWGQLPASQFGFDQVLDIGKVIQGEADDDHVDGVVVVQGTDSLEETSFAWDLLVHTDKPVVVVGAMRNASQKGFDGPDNLRNAILAAANPALRGTGVTVVMAGQIHGADDVVKTHTTAYATFDSPNFGPLGYVGPTGTRLARTRVPVRLPRVPRAVEASVALVVAVLGMSETAIAGEHGAAGYVIASMGAGNTDARILAAARGWLSQGLPVVLTSRCPSGSVQSGYGFDGGSSTWYEAGALFAGTLNPIKARVALVLALAAGLDSRELAALFGAFGGGSLEA